MTYDESYTFENTPEGYAYSDVNIDDKYIYNIDGSKTMTDEYRESMNQKIINRPNIMNCHHTTTAPNGERIGDLVGGTGAMVISGFGYDNFGGADMPGPTKTIKATDAAGVGMGGADVGRRVLGALQYLNSAFGLWTNDNKEDVISKYMNGLKKDSIYTIQGTERGQGFYRSQVPNKAAANRIKDQYEEKGLINITIDGKEKK